MIRLLAIQMRQLRAYYPDIFTIISASPGIQNKPFTESSDMEVHNNLYLQIEAMWAKNIQEQNLKNPY